MSTTLLPRQLRACIADSFVPVSVWPAPKYFDMDYAKLYSSVILGALYTAMPQPHSCSCLRWHSLKWKAGVALKYVVIVL